MSELQTEFDSPWKDLIEQYFEDFILFFFPQAHGEIEWSQGYEFLDKELQQVVRDAELGRRLVDKLVKIWRRFEWKLALTRRLYERGFSREDVINLFGFIDWVMSLPEALEQDFWREVRNLEEERQMPYITSVERIGIQKGIEQGIEQMRQVLLESLELGLELKFGSEGLGIFPEISQINSVEQLRAIMAGLKTVNTLSELRQIYQPTISE